MLVPVNVEGNAESLLSASELEGAPPDLPVTIRVPSLAFRRDANILVVEHCPLRLHWHGAHQLSLRAATRTSLGFVLKPLAGRRLHYFVVSVVLVGASCRWGLFPRN
jgi:hypothetical protein